MGDLKSLPAVFTLVGVLTICVLLQREVTGAIFIGMIVVSLLGIPFGLVEFSGVISSPPDLTPTLLKMDLTGALDLGVLTIIGVFVFVDLFDTAGTLIGVGQQGGGGQIWETSSCKPGTDARCSCHDCWCCFRDIYSYLLY